MRTKLYLFCLLVLAITSSSCSKSALSDIEITDPALVKVSVHIAQDHDNYKEVQVFIRDRNDRPVQLENGWVEVNGAEAFWDRAEIDSFGERGYIYYPDLYEHDFRIAIHLNPYDIYWFDLNPATGFPGFLRNYPLFPEELHSDYYPYIDEGYTLYDMPFRNGVVKVSYHILKRR